jgi:hypothetical protein
VAADSCDCLGVVGEVVGQPNSRLLCHDITISRCETPDIDTAAWPEETQEGN